MGRLVPEKSRLFPSIIFTKLTADIDKSITH